MFHPLRKMCSCGGEHGYILDKNGQAVVKCADCDKYQYNAPKSETGRSTRSVSRRNMKPSTKARILERDGHRCVTCGGASKDGFVLHIGHILSVDEAKKQGVGREVYDCDENLIAQCEECNLGQSSRPLPARLLLSLIVARSEANTNE